MDATKENAREALKKFRGRPSEDVATSKEEDIRNGKDLDFIVEFLTAAEKRLPTAESLARDRQRRKKVKAASE